jgi:nucleotide-binding universal stress UspA family protein
MKQERNGDTMKTIVVGIDDSEPAEAALELAAEEASLRGARLVIICAWDIPFAADPAIFNQAEMLDSLGADAQRVVRAAVARVAKLHPEVDCEGKALEGQPASVLLNEAKYAEMIVVGSRGRGGFGSLLMGSVSQQVVHHAPCPVIVVRHAES